MTYKIALLRRECSQVFDYIAQGSIYRWLNQDIVTADTISIEKVFSDWSASKAKYDSKYPQLRVSSRDYPLMSLQAIESWLTERLATIDKLIAEPQDKLPLCDSDELWAKEDVWKYYRKPGAKKATKNYTSSEEASFRKQTDGGEVVHFPGEVKRCTYCNVVEICDQAKGLAASGRLKL